jgi:hypothetical protein
MMPSVCSVFLLVAAAAGRSAGPFQSNAKQFRSCLINGRDVDLARFCTATRAYCDLLKKFGRFSGASIGNVRMCLAKIEAAQQKLERHASGKQRRALRSMRGLLQAELDADPPMHKPGAVLEDPSGAMGLLWVRRGLQVWVETFEEQIQVRLVSPSSRQARQSSRRQPQRPGGTLPRPRYLADTAPACVLARQVLKQKMKASKRKTSEPASTNTLTGWLWRGRSTQHADTLASQCRVAYVNTVERYHGRMSRTAFNCACRATPDWDVVVPRAGLCGCARRGLIPCALSSRSVPRGRRGYVDLKTPYGVRQPPCGSLC